MKWKVSSQKELSRVITTVIQKKMASILLKSLFSKRELRKQTSFSKRLRSKSRSYRQGWISKKQAQRYYDVSGKTINPTFNKVINYFYPPNFGLMRNKKDAARMQHEYDLWVNAVTPTGAVKSEAQMLLRNYLIKTSNSDSDYDYNVRVLLRQAGGVDIRRISFATSWLSRVFFDARRAVEGTSYYPCSIKDKIQIQAVQVFHRSFQNNFGHTTLVKLVDADGHIFIWWASTGTDAADGDTVIVKGTVKGFESRDNKLQTILTRCTLKVKEKAARAQCDFCQKEFLVSGLQEDADGFLSCHMCLPPTDSTQ